MATQGWRQNAWLLPISAVMLALLVYSVPRALPYHPERMNPTRPGLDYGLTSAHILFATVAIVTVCVGAWPWLRVHHPAVHTWSGRVYVLTALPAALLIQPMVLLNTTWEADIGAVATGAFWFASTLIGYVAMRQGNQPKHRRWMLYSFAMATSVVWGTVLAQIMTQPGQYPYLMELTRWVSPLLNLAVAKWWLDHTALRSAMVIPLPTKLTTAEPATSRAA
jgi:Predicted membrane protein (DUF2306)